MKESPPADFPKQESFIDCAGREINFALKCRRGPTGWIASGVERSDSCPGYQFEAFSPANPYVALGELRREIRRGLAIKYLAPGPEPQLSHDTAAGRIDWNSATDEVSLVIDGRCVSMANLSRLLATYEGWQFELKINDPGA